ncbi:MAG: adenylate/guanylate cyclase domain-containing protein [Methylocystis sp.]|uniref:adenylate/guanylate cyclase domain-containing protein n=1 Tax=Methylocystis sp. TaxID=1911079 RepID=UPI003DA41B61
MKLRTFFSAFFLVLVALAGANLVIGLYLQKVDRQTEAARERLSDITSLSEDLVISSQWATRFARGFVATKTQDRWDFYSELEDILEGRIARPEGYGLEYWDLVVGGFIPPPDTSTSGEGPLEDQFLKRDITIAEFNQLKKAKELFRKVSTTEKIAMHAVKGEFDDGTGKFAGKSKPDMALAERLIYGDEYNRENGELSEAVYNFNKMVRKRYKATLVKEEQRTAALVGMNIYLAATLFLIVLASVAFLEQRFVKRTSRLTAAVDSISRGNLESRTQVSGQDEIGRIAQSVESMARNLSVAFAALEEKVKISEKTALELNNERLRSEKLLHNILPATIAQRLQGGEEVIAEVFPEVTVFFSDIVGFTDLSARIGPHGTVNLLNVLFEKFDELVEKHGVEKIKTIGDSYMVVGGVPHRDPLHCQHVAEFALEAMAFIKNFSSQSPFPVEMRMGIHTGTVAAGVLGKKKFSYDLWGDVVNVASRFESTSPANKIHVSEAVKVRLADDFAFLDAGTVQMKGKGQTPSFYLLSRKNTVLGVVEPEKQTGRTGTAPVDDTV